MSVFQKSEVDYMIGGRQLGRLATVGADGTPHVVPVAFIYNAVRDTLAAQFDLTRLEGFVGEVAISRARQDVMVPARY